MRSRGSHDGAFFFAMLVVAVWPCCATFPCDGKTTAAQMLEGLNLSQKVAIVTGGDSGLGFAITRAMADRGATVVIANRNQSAGELVAKQVAAATGADVRAIALNLASLSSVRSFASDFLKEFGPNLNFLVNNAGITSPSVETSDGFELVFQIDYLGHFLLTELLLPALRNSSPARVVNVASGAHENACEMAGWPQTCFKDWTYLPPPTVPVKNVTVHYKSGSAVVKSSSYGIGKFMNIQHAAALASREGPNGVEAFSLTPGFALTNMTASAWNASSPSSKLFCKQQVQPDPSFPTNPCPFSADEGAGVIAHCLSGKARSGAYYSRTFACEERPVVMQGFTAEMQLELYTRSLSWAGVKSVPSGVEFV